MNSDKTVPMNYIQVKYIQIYRTITKHVNIYGDNSFMEAIFGSCDYNTVMWLIKEHVDVNCPDKDGLTAVHHAAHNGNITLQGKATWSCLICD